MYSLDESDEEFELNIIPMIDVIFAILTFFIISSLFLTKSESLPVNLPKADSAETQERTRIKVTVEPSGDISINSKDVPLDTLQDRVKELMEGANKSVIIINADEAVPHGRVIAVMDKVRVIEGVSLGIATEGSQDSEE